jgi:RHS repeat-associated protein
VGQNRINPSDVRTVTTSAGFDAEDREATNVDQFNHTSQTHYDAKGRVTQTIDVLNNATNSIYDARDQQIQTTNPDGTLSETVYDAEGRAIYTDDAHTVGQSDVRGTHTIYDSMGRVTETDRLDNLVISVTSTNGVYSSQFVSNGALLSATSSVYNDLGQITQSTDSASQITKYQYDSAGRQASVTDALNETTPSVYDADGQQIFSTDALNHVTQNVYDHDGRIVKSIMTDGTFSTSAYDSKGRQASVTDQMGRVTQYQYDSSNRMTAVIMPAVLDPETNQTINPTTIYSYDIYGNLSSIKDAKGRVTSFTFDQFGHQLTRTLPMSQQESTTYDAYGREATHVDFKGQTEVFHYDTLGRNDTKTFYPTGSQTPGETVTYHFDSLGRNDTITDVIGSTTRVTTYGYDLDNRVTSITTPEGTVNYAYDPATGFHTRTYTTNSDITYAPDQLQRLKTVTVTKQNGVTLGTALVTTYYYTAVSTIDHVTYPNGTETDYGYDTLNRLTSATNKKGSTVLSSYAYTLEADGLRTGVTEHQLEADGSTSTVTKIWTYDALQRLTQEAVTSSISANSYTDNYTMDLVGNRLTKTHTQGGQTLTSNCTYNSNDQLTTETGSGSSTYSTTYGYDANGSLTNVSRTGAGAETDSYGYDLQNRLSSANISRTESGQAVTIAASYSYNDDGIRGQSVVTTTIGNGSPTTTTTQFLVDSDNPTGFSQVLEEHTNGSSSPSMSYLIGLNVFGQTSGSGVTNFFLTEAQGSTRLVTDILGAIQARYAYDAYGNLLGAIAGVINPPLTRMLYANEQEDLSLQEDYMASRFYRPPLGEFTQFDSSMGNQDVPITLNKYIYGNDNPVWYIDPTGHDGLAGLTLGFSIASQIQNLKISADLAAFDAVTAVANGIEYGQSISQILNNFFMGQLIGFGIGYAFGKVLKIGSNLWEEGIVISVPARNAVAESRPIVLVNNTQFRFGPGKNAVSPRQAPRQLKITEKRLNVFNPAQRPRARQWATWGQNTDGVLDLRMNQDMVNVGGLKIGKNRPDFQFTLQGGRSYRLPNGTELILQAVGPDAFTLNSTLGREVGGPRT